MLVPLCVNQIFGVKKIRTLVFITKSINKLFLASGVNSIFKIGKKKEEISLETKMKNGLKNIISILEFIHINPRSINLLEQIKEYSEVSK